MLRESVLEILNDGGSIFWIRLMHNMKLIPTPDDELEKTGPDVKVDPYKDAFIIAYLFVGIVLITVKRVINCYRRQVRKIAIYIRRN